MIYECPQCQTPQEAGETVCPHCHAEFDGPVPTDAIVPAAEPADAEALAAAPEEPLSEEPVAAETLPVAEEAAASEQEAAADTSAPVPKAEPGDQAAAPPSAAAEAPPPSGPAPYLTSPSYSPPPYSPPSSTVTPLPYTTPVNAGGPSLGRLTRALLIAFPIVLVLVLSGVYLAGTLNTDSDAVPQPLPVVHAATPLPPAPAANAAPVTLQGGSNTNDSTDPHVKLLAGRWVSKSNDFYVFNSDGTGTRGSALNPTGDQPFLWGLVQNRLMLYGAKNETLRFNVGPDSDTVFLAPQTGHYVQYSRAKS